MTDGDARSLPGAAQAALRNRAVQAVLDGMTQAQAARVFRVHPDAVNRWIKRYREGGWAGLTEQRRGRRPGEQAALSESQQQRSSRWSARAPRPARLGGVSVDSGGGE
jgi:transposase